MKKIVIQLTDSYLLRFTLNEWGEHRTLKVESQWTGAKNPDGLQTRTQLTLDKDQWDELCSFLQQPV